jgi:hypothetical protein
MSLDGSAQAGCATPIMCSLTPEAIRVGRAGLLPGLREHASDMTPVDNGYQLTFPTSTEMLQSIVRTIDAERQCCRWLQFDLRVAPDGGVTLLTLSGPAGAQEFLAALFEL